ncbi:hypothetical protein ACU4GD_28375 [Cupriavidus basilensis]
MQLPKLHKVIHSVMGSGGHSPALNSTSTASGSAYRIRTSR